MFKNLNWKTPVLDLMLLMSAANLTIFYDRYEYQNNTGYMEYSGPGMEYWRFMIAAFLVLVAIKAGSLIFFAMKDKKSGRK